MTIKQTKQSMMNYKDCKLMGHILFLRIKPNIFNSRQPNNVLLFRANQNILICWNRVLAWKKNTLYIPLFCDNCAQKIVVMPDPAIRDKDREPKRLNFLDLPPENTATKNHMLQTDWNLVTSQVLCTKVRCGSWTV